MRIGKIRIKTQGLGILGYSLIHFAMGAKTNPRLLWIRGFPRTPSGYA